MIWWIRLIHRFEFLLRWHRRQGTADLFKFFAVYLFLPTQIVLLLLKPIIITSIGVGPGDVAFHPLNLTGSLSWVYLNLVCALIYVVIKSEHRLSSIRICLWALAIAQITYLYFNLFFGIFGNFEISTFNLLFMYTICAAQTYLLFLAIYLIKPQNWSKKAFKLQDMAVLFIAFFAISAKLINTQSVNVENLENIWLLLASGAFAAQFAKLTFEYFKLEI